LLFGKFAERKTGKTKAEWAIRLSKLGVGRDGLSVVFDMGLGCFRSVVHSVFVVTAG
jgi:hypothetical protein